MKAVVKKSQRPMYKENTEQVKIGIEVLSLLRFLSHAGSDIRFIDNLIGNITVLKQRGYKGDFGGRPAYYMPLLPLGSVFQHHDSGFSILDVKWLSVQLYF